MVEGGALEVSEEDVVDALSRPQRHRRADRHAGGAAQARPVRPPKMAWTKAAPPADLVARVKELAEGEDRRGDQPEGQAHAHRRRSRTSRRPFVEQLRPRTRRTARTRHACSATSSTTRCAPRCSTPGCASTGGKPERGPRDHDRHRRCCRAPTDRRCSRVARRRRWSPPRSARRRTCSASTPSTSRRDTKSFMLHYNFPPFSTGEVRPIRGTSRREIGHGNLAERALQGVLPPYRSSRTRSASCPTSSSRTARRRWRRCAARRSR